LTDLHYLGDRLTVGRHHSQTTEWRFGIPHGQRRRDAVRFDWTHDRNAGPQRQHDHAAIHRGQPDERDRSGRPFDHARILRLADFPNHRSARAKLAIRVRGWQLATYERDRPGGERDAIWL